MMHDERLPAEDTSSADHCDRVATLLKSHGLTSRITKIALTSSVGPISAFVAEPLARDDNAPPLLLLHGISRDAEEMFEAFRHAAVDAGRVVISPEFNKKAWRIFQRITDKIRPDIALLELLTLLRSAGMINGKPLEVFGFSGGAQLAHRWAMLYPHMVASLHVSSAGWYTSPSTDVQYPYGLGHQEAREKNRSWSRRMTKGLEAFLRLPISIYVGAEDCETEDLTLRRNPILDAAQGCERRMRAAKYRDAILSAALAHNMHPSVQFHELPGCGHSFAQCAASGKLPELVLD